MSKSALVKIPTGWNAPLGVENVHTLCGDKPESGGNNISVKSFERACVS